MSKFMSEVFACVGYAIVGAMIGVAASFMVLHLVTFLKGL